MIKEVIDVFGEINKIQDIRVVIIRGKGKSFSAGADLNWMRDVAKYSYDENYYESTNVSKCFFSIYTCKKPTIAVVHGAAIGGANGFLAACDLAYSEDETVFSLSEVKIGIIPACISPYITKRVGEYGAKDLMLTGRRINGKEAETFRLINKSLEKNMMDEYVNSIIETLITSGPKAINHCKNLIFEISNKLTLEEAGNYTAKMIAEIRISDEGQEGMAAFIEKRKPKWEE
jgi:methylglutaconyl-CoA hydratase